MKPHGPSWTCLGHQLGALGVPSAYCPRHTHASVILREMNHPPLTRDDTSPDTTFDTVCLPPGAVAPPHTYGGGGQSEARDASCSGVAGLARHAGIAGLAHCTGVAVHAPPRHCEPRARHRRHNPCPRKPQLAGEPFSGGARAMLCLSAVLSMSCGSALPQAALLGRLRRRRGCAEARENLKCNQNGV